MEDFYHLCDTFHAGSLCLQSINGSHITLIPKVDAPSHASDFRPISLLNTSMKILTKLLSNRPQKVITQIVHQNQNGFIKSRIIQDCVAWALEHLYLCHHSKKILIVLKLDFEKAFDKMEHKAIIKVMQNLARLWTKLAELDAMYFRDCYIFCFTQWCARQNISL